MRPPVRALPVCTAAVLALASPAAAAPDRSAFWSDGKAELSGYRMERERYGEKRTGQLVLIYVKEPFSDRARVKADPGNHPASDVFDVLKLNYVNDFQTGIYDYDLMTSVFSTFAPRKDQRAGAPVKVVFAAQEWCGAMFEELLLDPGKIQQRRFSYFDGEGDQDRTLDFPADGILADELPILVRSFPQPYLQPGESKKIKLLPQLEHTRLVHSELAWQDATIERSKGASSIEVPAGKFDVDTWTVSSQGGGKWSFEVERSHPHRLIRWRGPSGFVAELTGSERLPYWELNENGHEKLLPKLGLPVPGAAR